MIDGLIYGEDPRQGYTEDNVFYHPELLFKFPYPQGWTLYNSPSQVQIAPSDGKALMIFTLSGEASLDAASQAAVQQHNLTVVESARTQVNGFPAIAMVADQVPTQEQQQAGQTASTRLLSYFIQSGNMIYIFHGISSLADFNSYSNYFKRTMTNFSKLTDQSKINVKPTRLDVKQVTRSGTLQQALQALGAANQDLDELSIINGMLLTEQVQQGDLVKMFDKTLNRS